MAETIGYTTIAKLGLDLHRVLARWAEERLRLAGLEHIRVLGHFQPQGSSEPSLVIFPYRITPFPHLVENTPGVNLTGNWLTTARPGDPSQQRRLQGRSASASQLLPHTWRAVGKAVGRRLRWLVEGIGANQLGAGRNMRGHRGPMMAQITLDSLPPRLRDWYKAAHEGQREVWESVAMLVTPDPDPYEPWLYDVNGVEYARLPYLTWMPGFDMTFFYLLVGQGEARRDADWNPVDPPLSMPALTVISAGIQLERQLNLHANPWLISPYLIELIEILDEEVRPPDSLDEEPMDHDEPGALTELVHEASKPPPCKVALRPVHDLSNQEFSLLMQALQRPLEPAVNVSLGLKMGGGPRLTPGSVLGMASMEPGGGAGGPGGTGVR